jgi:hypothetical protein
MGKPSICIHQRKDGGNSSQEAAANRSTALAAVRRAEESSMPSSLSHGYFPESQVSYTSAIELQFTSLK